MQASIKFDRCRATMIFSEDSSTLPLDEFLLIQPHVNLDWKVLIRMKRLICIGNY
jgi:hypothetical protein